MALIVLTWTQKVCRIIAVYRFWAIILPTFGGPGSIGVIGFRVIIWGILEGSSKLTRALNDLEP